MDAIIGKLLAFVAGAIAIALLWPIAGAIFTTKLDTTAAYPFRAVTGYAQSYAKANYTALYAAAAGGPVPITVAMLQTSGMPAGFQNANSFGQQHGASFCRPAAGDAILIVYTFGGDVIEDKALRSIALEAEEFGGYVSTEAPAVITTQNGYQYPLSECPGIGAVLTAGHLANVYPLTALGTISPYLCRHDTGDPECNTMRTNINMGGNSITDADDFCSSTTGKCMSEGLIDSRQLVSGGLMPRPNCPANHVPGVYFGGGAYSDSGTGKDLKRYEPIIDLATSTPTHWRIRIYVYTEDNSGTGSERIEVVPPFGSVAVHSTCIRT